MARPLEAWLRLHGGRALAIAAALALTAGSTTPGPAAAQDSIYDSTPEPDSDDSGDSEEKRRVFNPEWLDNEWYKFHLNVLARIELADQDGFENAEAYTIRTRVGLEAKPWMGFSALGELENNFSLDDDSYFDGASSPNGKTQIADPEDTALNRAWLQYETDQILGTEIHARAKGGRQRIVFDDARFIGNVVWRQLEQTFDAALGETDFTVDDLSSQYAFLWNINRIFGDQGPSPSTQDFDSESHLARVHYTGFEGHEIVLFTYFLDFENDSPSDSSNSYGFRALGDIPLTDEWSLGYIASYAYQTDAKKNPVNYDAHYGWISLDAKLKEWGALGVGYEHLGSDEDARFVTPLATGHAFNGFADAFLDNGGVKGLQDLFVTLTPALPWGLKGKIIYHEFWRADGGSWVGREVDYVVSKQINRFINVLSKGAWFDGDNNGPDDRWRWWFQVELKY